MLFGFVHREIIEEYKVYKRGLRDMILPFFVFGFWHPHDVTVPEVSWCVCSVRVFPQTHLQTQ